MYININHLVRWYTLLRTFGHLTSRPSIKHLHLWISTPMIYIGYTKLEYHKVVWTFEIQIFQRMSKIVYINIHDLVERYTILKRSKYLTSKTSNEYPNLPNIYVHDFHRFCTICVSYDGLDIWYPYLPKRFVYINIHDFVIRRIFGHLRSLWNSKHHTHW